MKRDMDLARSILLEVEKCSDPWGLDQPLEIEGATEEEVSYHVKILDEAGLLEANDALTMGPDGFCWLPRSLTWEGHQFLDASRDDARWKRTKEVVLAKSGGLAYEAIKYVLISGIKSALS